MKSPQLSPATQRLLQPHVHGALTRRQFLKAGAAAATLAVGTGFSFPQLVGAEPEARYAPPRPIPYGTQFLYPDPAIFHVEAPGYPLPNPPFDTNPATNNPATITDFNGIVGLGYVGGQGTHLDLTTHQKSSVYWEVDMRFMVGEYVGTDGRLHHGTFGFVWLDVFVAPGGQQLHDFNPGIAPDGRFWTIPMSPDHVDVNPVTGRATYSASHMPMGDYGANALTGGTPVPGSVSFAVEWAPSTDRHTYRYAPHRWEGTFVQTDVTCQWAGRTAATTFVTDTNNPSIFAEVGYERSGVFFR